MFRDESSKVIQKAHAQWGSSGPSPIEVGRISAPASDSVPSSDDPASTLAEAPSASAPPSPMPFSTPIERWAGQPPSAASDGPSSPPRNLVPARIPRKVDFNIEQRGLHFYISRYLVGHPDSPRTHEQVAGYFLAAANTAQNVMVAVGLAGMSNVLGDRGINMLSRSKYVTALKDTGKLLATVERTGLIPRIRSVIALALFEVVQGRGPKGTVGSASTHINGALAVLRSVLPLPHSPYGGAHGALQLLFSMFIPYQMINEPLPPVFFETLRFSKELMNGSPGSCTVDLALAVAQVLQLSSIVENTALTDGSSATDNLVQQLLILDDVFESLEARLFEAFPFTENQGEYPPEAVFRGKWHGYREVWGARTWNHYRWGRILANRRLVQLINDYPASSRKFAPAGRRKQCYDMIERLAEGVLISTPSHWYHPTLSAEVTKKFESKGQGGSGAVGLPSLLWQLTAAGCAPNVPLEFWQWAYNVLQVVWKQMGMLHALALSEVMQEHRARLEKAAINHRLELEGD
ncbi:hypothetical protein GGS23DRAFT_568861 [Durotheca rogersii]|uniref:uncharacterized protein n=1 Tax=Durotheca rogersii TaxID=419775 RepID=UPI0022200F66|nr:uncharacterized protein GGS23DRAFT_568861 [Durotheca rogersii]KAI5863235.1 hypothetical protein GGS23DRAFT_568861 [Durotheca rogersii]